MAIPSPSSTGRIPQTTDKRVQRGRSTCEEHFSCAWCYDSKSCGKREQRHSRRESTPTLQNPDRQNSRVDTIWRIKPRVSMTIC